MKKLYFLFTILLLIFFNHAETQARNLLYVADDNMPTISVYDSETFSLIETISTFDTESIVPGFKINSLQRLPNRVITTNATRNRLFISSVRREANPGVYWPWDTGALAAFESFSMARPSNNFQNTPDEITRFCIDDVIGGFNSAIASAIGGGTTNQGTLLVAACNSADEIAIFNPGEENEDDYIETSDGREIMGILDDPVRIANVYVVTLADRVERMTYFTSGTRTEGGLNIPGFIDWAIAPDGTKLFVADSSGFINIVSLPNMQLLNRITIAGGIKDLQVHTNQPLVYILTDTNQISTLNYQTSIVTSQTINIPTDQALDKIRLSQNSDTLYVMLKHRSEPATSPIKILKLNSSLIQTGEILLNQKGSDFVVSQDFANRIGSGLNAAPSLKTSHLRVEWKFRQVPNTGTLKQTLILNNLGNQPLVISSLQFNNSAFKGKAGNYNFGSSFQQTTQAGYCGNTIAGLSSCKIEVMCNPSSISTYTGNLQITSNASPSVQNITLSCQALIGPHVAAPMHVELQYEDDLQPVSQTITITNDGNQPLDLMALDLVENEYRYTISQACLSAPLAPNASCNIDVTCYPKGVNGLSPIPANDPLPTFLTSVVTVDNSWNQTNLVPVSCRSKTIDPNYEPPLAEVIQGSFEWSGNLLTEILLRADRVSEGLPIYTSTQIDQIHHLLNQ